MTGENIKSILNKKKLIFIVLLIIAAVVFSLLSAGRFLVVSDSFSKQQPTYIIILMGSLPDRTLGAYDLVKEMPDYHIYVVKSQMKGIELLQERGVFMSNFADLSAKALRDLGIPDANITVIDGEAASTRDEALLLRSYFGENLTERQLVIVTSKYHSKRAGWIFKNIFNETGRKIYVYATLYDTFDAEHWFKNREDIEKVIFEWIKLFHFLLWEKWVD